MDFGMKIKQRYTAQCYGPDGVLKWSDTFDNLVTTEGLNKYLDATLKTGLTTPAWYVGLVGAKSTGYFAADTLALHAGWTEGNPYTGNRPAWTPGVVSGGSVDNSVAKASFAITATATVFGCFVCSALSGAAGILLGVGDFGASKGVSSGDTLQVTVTCSLS